MTDQARKTLAISTLKHQLAIGNLTAAEYAYFMEQL